MIEMRKMNMIIGIGGFADGLADGFGARHGVSLTSFFFCRLGL